MTATVSGTTITLVSIAQGAAANYALSYSSDGDFNVNFSGAAMTGGTTGTPVPGGLNQQYALDNWGNLSSMGSSGFNQSVNMQNQVSSFSYDAAGRLQNDGALTYTYDDDGMLLTSSDGASYTYGASGNRVQVAKGSSQKAYVYFGGQLLATYDPATAAWTDMIYAGGQRIAEVAGTPAATPVYSVLDHIGSEVAAVASNGTAISALDYTPLGQLISGTNPDAFIFTGLERDGDGLDHATFRQYSSTTGRWTVPDPYDGSYDVGDPQSLNRYAYVRNNPLAFTDKSGLGPIYPCGTGSNGLPSFCMSTPTYSFCGSTCNVFVTVLSLGINALIDSLFGGSAPTFHGNVRAQNQGKRVRITNGNHSTANDPAPHRNCAIGARVVQGLIGVANLGDAYVRAQAVGAGTLALAEAPPAAAVYLIYGTTSVFGQALAGGAQVAQAVTGNGGAQPLEQIGNVLSGPASGLTTLVVTGGNLEKAATYANRESFFNGGVGLVNKAAPPLLRLGEFALGAIGLGSVGCGTVP
ncbi:MAG: RHS repeat-associated core domain-containing protein [Edaphobacter sp.]